LIIAPRHRRVGVPSLPHTAVRMTGAADDFVAIRTRMEEHKREREEARRHNDERSAVTERRVTEDLLSPRSSD